MLFRKMIRDIMNHKTQFISIFLMAFLGVFIYSGVGGEWQGLKRTSDGFYDETNLADIWLYGNGFSKDDINKVSKVKGVTEVQGRMSIDGIGDFNNKPKLKLFFLDQNVISKCKVLEGEEFSCDKDGVWVDNRFADSKKLKLGDKLKVTTNGISLEKKILGLIQQPEFVYCSGEDDIIPNHDNFGFAYFSYKVLPEGMKIIYTDILVTTDNKSYDKLEERIDEALDCHYSISITRDNFPSYNMFNGEVSQHRAMGKVFPIAFLSIAMLTIITTMTRIINNQRTQIGTLKALGFKKRKILFHYIAYGFWIPLLGSLLGAIVGPLTLPYLFYDSLKTAYTLPEWKPSISLSFLGMVVISVGICTVITYFTCRNVLKDTPAETLRPKMPKMMKHNLFTKSKLWARLGFNTQWNVRDIFRSKVRSLMAVVGVVGCMALLVCAFGMEDSLDDVISWQYSDIYKFNTKITVEEDANMNQIDNIIEKSQGEALMEGNAEVKANGKKLTGDLLVTDNTTLIKNTNAKRQFIDLPEDSLSISYKLANNLNVKIGDKIQWHIYGDEMWVESTIGAIYRTPLSQGITITRNYFEKIGYKFSMTSVVTTKDFDEKLEGIVRIWSTKELTESYDTMSEAMNIMVYILIFGAAILAVVVLYNLGIISFVERERELATLKVIGFKTKRIRKLLLTQTIWLTNIGIVIGAPFGKFLIDYMCSFMGDSFDMMTVINVSSLFYSILIALGLSILVNIWLSRRIKTIDMVGALKGVE